MSHSLVGKIVMALVGGRWVVGETMFFAKSSDKPDMQLVLENPCDWQPQIAMDPRTGMISTAHMLIPIPVKGPLPLTTPAIAEAEADIVRIYRELVEARRSTIVRPPSGLRMEGGHRPGA